MTQKRFEMIVETNGIILKSIARLITPEGKDQWWKCMATQEGVGSEDGLNDFITMSLEHVLKRQKMR